MDLKKLDPKTTCLGPETLCLVNDLIQEFFEMLILEVNTLVKKKEHEGEGEGEICNKIFTTVYDVQEAARRVIPGVFLFVFYFLFCFVLFCFSSNSSSKHKQENWKDTLSQRVPEQPPVTLTDIRTTKRKQYLRRLG